MKSLFEEKQRYDQWWLWLIIVSAAFLVVGIFGHGMYVQLVLGEPWGDHPQSDDLLIINSMVVISLMVFMLLIFFNALLETGVDRSGIRYRYFPIIRKWRQIDRETIESFHVKKSYLKGYGIKRDLHGNRFINVKGTTAIEIVTYGGKKILLGTQRPEEFIEALNKMKKGSSD